MSTSIPQVDRKGLDPKAVDRQTKAIAGLCKLLADKGFYGNLVIRFEAGSVVKCDNSSSLRIADIEQLLKSEGV